MGGGIVDFKVCSELFVVAADMAHDADGRPDEGYGAKNKDSE
jgi:hypothetical protein